MIDLKGTPYLLEAAAAANLQVDLRELHERVEALRSMGRLTPATLETYYGQTRFEQVAESNAIEGSTLSPGETELAVLKGVTLSGHDPRFVDAARNLDRALLRLRELARVASATDILQVKELHALVLGGGPGAGSFRQEEVRIAGAMHKPPRTWNEVMAAMEEWESWSGQNVHLSAVLRSAVLHAWLTHIHPFRDGNGRTARAVGNLELIRAGFPPILIKKTKHRERYLRALAESDDGDLSPFLDLVRARTEDALRDLERAASQAQGYDAVAQALRRKQQGRLDIWNAAVDLLVTLVASELRESLEATRGDVEVERFRDSLDLDEFVSLCEQRSISDAWSFRVRCDVPGLRPVERLAWLGFRSTRMVGELGPDAPRAPSIFWSERNPEKYPPWRRLRQGGPGAEEITLVGDVWIALEGGRAHRLSHGELARRIASGLADFLS